MTDINQLDIVNAIERILAATGQSFVLILGHHKDPNDLWVRSSTDRQVEGIALRNLAERGQRFALLRKLEPTLRELDAGTGDVEYTNIAILELIAQVNDIQQAGAPSVMIHGAHLVPDDKTNPDQAFLDKLTLLKRMVANFINEVTPRIQSGEMHPDGDFHIEVKRITPHTTGTAQ